VSTSSAALAGDGSLRSLAKDIDPILVELFPGAGFASASTAPCMAWQEVRLDLGQHSSLFLVDKVRKLDLNEGQMLLQSSDIAIHEPMLILFFALVSTHAHSLSFASFSPSFESTCRLHFTYQHRIGLQIALRPYNHAGDLAHSTKFDDLVMHNLNHVERIARCDGVDEDIARVSRWRIEN